VAAGAGRHLPDHLFAARTRTAAEVVQRAWLRMQSRLKTLEFANDEAPDPTRNSTATAERSSNSSTSAAPAPTGRRPADPADGR